MEAKKLGMGANIETQDFTVQAHGQRRTREDPY